MLLTMDFVLPCKNWHQKGFQIIPFKLWSIIQLITFTICMNLMKMNTYSWVFTLTKVIMIIRNRFCLNQGENGCTYMLHCKYLNARSECNDIVISVYSHYPLNPNAKSSDTKCGTLSIRSRTTDTQWRHKCKISENLGRCGRQNMLRPYIKIWDWDWIFGSAVKAISSLGVRSPWHNPRQQEKSDWRFAVELCGASVCNLFWRLKGYKGTKIFLSRTCFTK